MNVKVQKIKITWSKENKYLSLSILFLNLRRTVLNFTENGYTEL